MKTKHNNNIIAALAGLTATVCIQSAVAGNSIKADFNGDGYADLVIGNPRMTFNNPSSGLALATEAGSVNVIYGTATGLNANVSTAWNQNLTGIEDVCEQGDLFGANLAAGDINRDGFTDLVVSVPGETDSTGNRVGAIQVLLGSATGLKTGGNQIIPGSRFGTSFFSNTFKLQSSSNTNSCALDCDDFNGDGFCDVVVEVVRTSLSIGKASFDPAVLFIPGSANGLNPAAFRSVTLPADTAKSNLVFESADFNRDGYQDLVVGAPGASVGVIQKAGSVRILFGSTSGPTLSNARLIHQNLDGVPEISESDDAFGAALAVGDFNRDQKPDLAVGVPSEDADLYLEASSSYGITYPNNNPNAGTAHIFYGDGSSVALSESHILNSVYITSLEGGSNANSQPEEGDANGTALAAGDFDGDGYKDLAIGAPGENSAMGMVSVYYGTPAGLSWGQDWFEHDVNPSASPSSGRRFGASLIAANFGRNYTQLVPGPFPGSISQGFRTLHCDDLAAVTPGRLIRVLYGYKTGLAISTGAYSASPLTSQPGPSQAISAPPLTASFVIR